VQQLRAGTVLSAKIGPVFRSLARLQAASFRRPETGQINFEPPARSRNRLMFADMRCGFTAMV